MCSGRWLSSPCVQVASSAVPVSRSLAQQSPCPGHWLSSPRVQVAVSAVPVSSSLAQQSPCPGRCLSSPRVQVAVSAVPVSRSLAQQSPCPGRWLSSPWQQFRGRRPTCLLEVGSAAAVFHPAVMTPERASDELRQFGRWPPTRHRPPLLRSSLRRNDAIRGGGRFHHRPWQPWRPRWGRMYRTYVHDGGGTSGRR